MCEGEVGHHMASATPTPPPVRPSEASPYTPPPPKVDTRFVHDPKLIGGDAPPHFCVL